MFDKRDTGLSDRDVEDTSLEQRIGDVDAVMRACRSNRTVLFGLSEGGPMSILFAATHPERVQALILGTSAARWPSAPDYPCGPGPEEMLGGLEVLGAQRWGQGESIEWYAPSRAHSSRARQKFARWERMSASPGAYLRLLQMIRTIDVRSVLPTVGAPALVIQREGDRVAPRWHGRYLAEHLPRARYFEQPGDHLLWLGDTDAMFTEIEDFLAGAADPPEPDRVLATILIVDGLPDALTATVPRSVASHRGRVVRNAGDSVLATFDGPGRAIRCAAALHDAAAALGISVQAGVHTGEVELRGDDVAGTSVQIAAQVAAIARAAETLVSHTVKDLMVGSDVSFAARGTHQLKDVADPWPLFAVSAS